MTIKIDKKITGFDVVKESKATEESEATKEAKPMTGEPKEIKRPEELHGVTYKIEPPESAAIYITINDMKTESGFVPYEIFINSKQDEHFQWTVAVTRLVSAMLRHGIDPLLVVEEMRSIFDPNGGFFFKRSFTPSVVAAIGTTIEKHLENCGILKERNPAMQASIEAKKQALDKSTEKDDSKDNFPANATKCKKCGIKAVVILDGCQTCLSCGDSKCG